jgi:hypothetical protein
MSWWDNVKDARCWNEEVITPLASPFKPDAGMAVLRGNLAPDGAVIKPSAASPALMKHTGRAVVFEDIEVEGVPGGKWLTEHNVYVGNIHWLIEIKIDCFSCNTSGRSP